MRILKSWKCEFLCVEYEFYVVEYVAVSEMKLKSVTMAAWVYEYRRTSNIMILKSKFMLKSYSKKSGRKKKSGRGKKSGGRKKGGRRRKIRRNKKYGRRTKRRMRKNFDLSGWNELWKMGWSHRLWVNSMDISFPFRKLPFCECLLSFMKQLLLF